MSALSVGVECRCSSINQTVCSSGSCDKMLWRANVVRVAAVSGEKSEKHKRLSARQFEELCLEFHEWRTKTNGGARMVTCKRRMEHFLEFLSSGGLYRKTAKAEEIAKSTIILHCQEAANFLENISGRIMLIID